ncbi:MAG: ankyrin repeat domain-containing protein [Rhizomicrobium sp.]
MDYSGDAVGMPKAVTSVERAVDYWADTKIWVSGDARTFENLKSEGWDFRATDDNHLAIIESASRGGSGIFVHELLLAGVSARNNHGCEGLAAAAEQGNVAIVAMLLNAGAPLNWPPDENNRFGCDALDRAAYGGVPQIVRMIFSHNPDVNSRNAGRSTPLLIAAETCLRKVHSRGLANTAVVLIAAGADVNSKDSDGDSALMKCPYNAGFVRALLAVGAIDVNTADETGATPLMNAFEPAVIEALLKAGADPYLKDKKGHTALDMDTENPPVMRLLKRWMVTHPKKSVSP